MQTIVRTLCLALVVGATIAALPAAAASAVVWRDGVVPVTKEFSIGIQGAEIFEVDGSLGSMECAIDMTMTGGMGSSASITKWKEEECLPGFGSLAGCVVSVAEGRSLPWAATLSPVGVGVTNMHIKRTYKTGCSKSETNVTLTSAVFSPDEMSSIHEFGFNGQGPNYLAFGTYVVIAGWGTTGIG
jgi:hypothetical protein